MAPPIAASAYDLALAVHIIAVMIAFGVTFAYPIMYAVGARHGARSLPLVHRMQYTTERFLVNPGLAVLVLAGIFLASDGHHWSEFFVQWGLGVALVIGAVSGAVMIPATKRAEQLAERDINASEHGDPEMSAEYRVLIRRTALAGTFLNLLILVTILFMVVKP